MKVLLLSKMISKNLNGFKKLLTKDILMLNIDLGYYVS